MPKFFAFDGVTGDWEIFDSSEEAEHFCESVLDTYRDWAKDDGWEESVTTIFWGEIHAKVTETHHETRPECEGACDDDCENFDNCLFAGNDADEIAEYELKLVT